MSNIICNYLFVAKGDPKPVWEAVKSTESVFDFNRIIPEPTNWVEKDGTPREPRPQNWYKWRLKNWGDKWNAVRATQRTERMVRFETAWEPPVPVIKKLSELFPEHEFELVWYDTFNPEEGDFFIKFKNGEIVSTGAVDDFAPKPIDLVTYNEATGEAVFVSRSAVKIQSIIPPEVMKNVGFYLPFYYIWLGEDCVRIVEKPQSEGYYIGSYVRESGSPLSSMVQRWNTPSTRSHRATRTEKWHLS
jgi:hypothetical protein